MSKKRIGHVCLGLFCIASFTAEARSDVLFDYADFSRPGGLSINGIAAIVDAGDATVLRLTPSDATFAAGSTFSPRIETPSEFSTFFQFRLSDPGPSLGAEVVDCNGDRGADGLAFVLQSESPTALGGNGIGIGYQGLESSVAIEFDAWCNREIDESSSNHVALTTRGRIAHNDPSRMADISPEFENGRVWSGWLDYDGSELQVRLNSDTEKRPLNPVLNAPLDIASVLSGQGAYVGFTSGTGIAWANHDVLSWEFRNEHTPIGLNVSGEFSFPDFSEATSFTMNGAATVFEAEGEEVLRLTQSGIFNQVGSAFTEGIPTPSGFSTFFQFRISDSGGEFVDCNGEGGADGLAFVVQSEGLDALGGSGIGLGYQGLDKSVAVEFDSWCNTELGEATSNHVAISVGGNISHDDGSRIAGVTPGFEDGQVWSAWLDYDGTELQVRLSTDAESRPVSPLLTATVDVSTLLDNSEASVGFTSGTGGAWASHDILSWEYRNEYRPFGVTRLGDFNNDGTLDGQDIDTLVVAIREGDVTFDLNGDGTIDLEDQRYWVHELAMTYVGDSNLDGEFNSSDLVLVFASAKHETGAPATWNEGDWNADGVFDTSDLVSAFANGGYEQGPRNVVSAVPEPTSALQFVFAASAVGLVGRRKWS